MGGAEGEGGKEKMVVLVVHCVLLHREGRGGGECTRSKT